MTWCPALQYSQRHILDLFFNSCSQLLKALVVKETQSLTFKYKNSSEHRKQMCLHLLSWASNWGSAGGGGGGVGVSLAPTSSNMGVSLDHEPLASKFPECKMGAHEVWHKRVEIFMGELNPATAANRWDLHEICIFSGCVGDKCLFLKGCHHAKAGMK